AARIPDELRSFGVRLREQRLGRLQVARIDHAFRDERRSADERVVGFDRVRLRTDGGQAERGGQGDLVDLRHLSYLSFPGFDEWIVRRNEQAKNRVRVDKLSTCVNNKRCTI